MSKLSLVALTLGALTLGALTLGAGAPLAANAQAALPDGPGKPVVAQKCGACHELSRVTGAGYDAAGWRNTVYMMVNMGAPLSPQEVDQAAAYLAAHYPATPQPAAVLIPGPVKVDIQEWDVPTPGSRPHDPLATPDGMIWYTGQMANVLGRLDPRTGRFTEFRLPPRSGPHGLVADRAGDIWFTANFAGYVGKLDPKTGQVVQYPTKDPAARDPHTLAFDRDGILWFTLQSADKIGRLDPRTGEMKLVDVPTPHANPYGLVITSQGAPVFDEFGTNRIGTIDPATMKIREIVLPHPESRPRRIAITAGDVIWYTDYARGDLGRLDLKTGEVSEFASPGGSNSQPYAITALHGVIWYVESNTKPNALVRYDPATGRFQTFAIPSGGGVVRNMTPTADGRGLALACSGVNKVALATIR